MIDPVAGLELSVTEGVARITFNRPERANAISPDWLPAIRAFLEIAGADPTIRALLIDAKGKHFQAGGDLSLDLDEPLPDLTARVQALMDGWNEMLIAIATLPKPVIAAVQGGCIGASMALVAACDLVIAADDAFFVVAQVKIGASLDGLPSYFLPRKVGLSRAIEWAFLGERISATMAAEAGLVTRVVSRATLADAALALSARLAAGPTRALGLTKALLNQSSRAAIAEQAAAETAAYLETIATEDWREGVSAFMEKRASNFMGR